MVNFVFRFIDLFVPAVMLYISMHVTGLSKSNDPYVELSIIASFFMVILNELRGGYSQADFNRTLAKQLELTFENWLVVSLSLITYLYLVGASHLAARRAIIVWLLITPVLIVIIKMVVNHIHIVRSPITKLLVVGSEINLTLLEQHRIQKSNLRIHYCESILTCDVPDKTTSIIFNYHTPPSLIEIKALTHMELSGIKLISVNEFYEKYLRKCYIPYVIRDIEFMNNVTRPRGLSFVTKVTVDVVLTLFLLAVSFPLLIFSMLKIKQESPGGVFFHQTRVGVMMKNFKVIKFRSMHENSEFIPYTRKQDVRVFPYGRLMRKLRVDELPQILNVLRGEMHFIGPRAEWDILVDNYEKEIPYYHERHIVKPGITGWAQVMYPYGENTEDARQKLMYDLYYIKHWNIWLEVETIIRTVSIVLGRKGL